jgi:hypothetical protein
VRLDVKRSFRRYLKYTIRSPKPSARFSMLCAIYHVPDFRKCYFLYINIQRVLEAHLEVPLSMLCYEYEFTITMLKTLH